MFINDKCHGNIWRTIYLSHLTHIAPSHKGLQLVKRGTGWKDLDGLFQSLTTLRKNSDQQVGYFTSHHTYSCPIPDSWIVHHSFVKKKEEKRKKKSWHLIFLRILFDYLTRFCKTTHIISLDLKLTLLCFISPSFCLTSSLYKTDRIILKKQRLGRNSKS